MIRYEDITKQISTLEKRHKRNEEKIKIISQENNEISAKLKVLNQKRELFEKMDSDLSNIIPSKKSVGTIVSTDVASTE